MRKNRIFTIVKLLCLLNKFKPPIFIKNYLLSAALLLSMFYFSCSPESDLVIGDPSEAKIENLSTNPLAKSLTSSDLNTAIQQYAALTKTKAYTDYINSIEAFNLKLLSNNISFDTRSQWMTWINSNISSTSFNSVLQFQSMYDNSILLQKNMIAANPNLFNFIKNASGGQIRQIFAPEFHNNIPGGYPISTSSCIDDCIDWCDGALDLIDNILVASLEIAQDASSQSVYEQATLRAYQAHRRSYLGISGQFNQCVGNC